MENYKEQVSALKQAEEYNKTENGCFHSLRSYNNEHKIGLSKVQSFLIARKNLNKGDNQERTLNIIRSVYNKRQNLKIDQIERIKNGQDLLTEPIFIVFLDTIKQKTFKSEEKAVEYINSDLNKFKSECKIVQSEQDIKCKFSVLEALKISQKIDKAYKACFNSTGTVTFEKIERALKDSASK